jgi:hypothetical protein
MFLFQVLSQLFWSVKSLKAVVFDARERGMVSVWIGVGIELSYRLQGRRIGGVCAFANTATFRKRCRYASDLLCYFPEVQSVIIKVVTGRHLDIAFR